MSLDQLKDEVQQLNPQQQRELVGYIISLQTEQNAAFRETLAQKIDNDDPANWVELDDVKQRLVD